MAADPRLAGDAPRKPTFLARLKPSAPPLLPHRRDKNRSSDWVVAALGIALGLVCALFPWYIFFNQDKFGVRAVAFEGGHDRSAPGPVVSGGPRVGAPLGAEDMPALDLDLLSTGSVAASEPPAETPREPAPQPFPVQVAEFRLVHVANDRAMLEDDTGLFVVQRGSRLPDSSHVKAIEERGGKWVLVTSEERVLEMVE